MNVKDFGVKGEAAAAEYLRKKGYKILEMNFSFSGGEIDIIAKYKKFLCFIEVKSRTSFFAGRPCEAVTPSKMKRIKMASQLYVYNNPSNLQPRFDIVEIIADRETSAIKEINHIESAFC